MMLIRIEKYFLPIQKKMQSFHNIARDADIFLLGRAKFLDYRFKWNDCSWYKFM